KTARQRRRHRTDARNGRDAERETGDENAETLEPATQLTPGKTRRQREGGFAAHEHTVMKRLERLRPDTSSLPVVMTRFMRVIHVFAPPWKERRGWPGQAGP